jgi:hypothetical protein
VGVMPLGNRIFALESRGRVVRGHQTATRRVGAFVRTTTAQAPYTSAITVFGHLNRAGNATISGTDLCGGTAAAGVMAVAEGMVTGQTQGQKQKIFGEPPVDYDPNMTQDKLSDFGDIDLDYLRENATFRYQGNPAWPQNMAPTTTINSAGQSVCNLGDTNNWGDNTENPGPCGGYYPIVHIQGNGKFDTGEGQGIIIVDGDLYIDGNFDFAGVVIVTGKLFMAGTSTKIKGMVIVQGGGELDTLSEQEGTSMIQYDSCKVRNAFNSNLRVRPLVSRSWFTDTPPLPVVGS